MKKYLSTLKYKKYSRKHAYAQLKKRLKHKAWRKRMNKQEQGVSRKKVKERNIHKKKYWDYETVLAPDNFSFLENTIEIVRFIQKLLEFYDKKTKVFISLTSVWQIDYGAIVVLLSIMIKFKLNHIDFDGNFPTDPQANALLKKSGFLDSLFKPSIHEDRYAIIPKLTDSIHTHAWKDVDSKLGQEIILAASKTIWGEHRRCQGVQRTLIELMLNTNNHAEIGKTGTKHWWLSVNHSPKEKKVCFSFVDFGVGVITSLNNKPHNSKFHNWLNKLTKHYTFSNNAELLGLILEGKLHLTVTDKHFRGKGLPGIAEVQRRNQISNLVIITNNVKADVSKNEYKLLDNSFDGTFVYWEVSNANESCK